MQDREKEDAFPLYFEDMMTGHWAASYYRLIFKRHLNLLKVVPRKFFAMCSHTWSKMLAADIFSAYIEAGLDNPQVRQRDNIIYK